MDSLAQSIRIQLLNGDKSSQELSAACKVSQSTVSRRLTSMGDRIARIGQSHSARYALRQGIADLGTSWPLFIVTPEGEPAQIGRLHTLAKSACWVERTSPDKWDSLFEEDFKDGIFPGLPWFLDDARPQGFLGRAFARKYGSKLGQGIDPTKWSNDAVIESLIRFGDNLPGAFVLGKSALVGALRDDCEPVVEINQKPRFYPHLAEAVLKGDVIGSSAGGEQPKFTVRLGNKQHVLVKFTPPLDSAEGRRWADLLYSEKVAADVLSENGFIVPRSEMFDFKNRRFLEVERFDRTPQGGRIPIASLSSLDGAFFGTGGSSWDKASTQMHDEGWLDEKNASQFSSLWRFGELIGNTDMHFGNASFILSPSKPVSLSPVYDMLPMLYRPQSEGRLPGYQGINIPDPTAKEVTIAEVFWQRVAASSSVSDEFRNIAARHADDIHSRVNLLPGSSMKKRLNQQNPSKSPQVEPLLPPKGDGIIE